MEMTMTTSPIGRTRLWIEHAKCDSERRAEIEAEMLDRYSLVFRTLAPQVGVWETPRKRR